MVAPGEEEAGEKGGGENEKEIGTREGRGIDIGGPGGGGDGTKGGCEDRRNTEGRPEAAEGAAETQIR